MNRKIILVALAMVVALALVGCTAQNVLPGTTWRTVDSMQEKGREAFSQLFFAKNGTLESNLVYSSGEIGASMGTGTWSANGNEVTMDINGIRTVSTVEIKGQKMVMTDSKDGKTYEYTKVK